MCVLFKGVTLRAAPGD